MGENIPAGAEPAAETDAPPITRASVKVMRSFDYCHFEVVLGSDAEVELTQIDGSTVHVRQPLTTAQVDVLRKAAARLADKAVAQYKVAKAAAARLERMEDRRYLLERAIATPEGERSPEEMALIKYCQDEAFASRFRYDYEDDWHGEEGF